MPIFSTEYGFHIQYRASREWPPVSQVALRQVQRGTCIPGYSLTCSQSLRSSTKILFLEFFMDFFECHWRSQQSVLEPWS